MNFSQLINISGFSKKSLLCVGLDPDIEKIPVLFESSSEPFFDFCRVIVRNTHPFASSFKIQHAYFAAQGREAELKKLIAFIKSNYPETPVILDSKRGDIPDTAKKYAEEAFERFEADAVTVNPYMGIDTLAPFFKYSGKGIFVLARTSNPGGADFQNLKVAGEKLLYHVVIERCLSEFDEKDLGFVVGATAPDDVEKVRSLAPKSALLIPGVGTQGGEMEKVLNLTCLNNAGVLVNVSRSILYASCADDFAEKAAEAAEAFAKVTSAYVSR